MNRIYGNGLLSFILLNLPIKATILMSLLLNRSSYKPQVQLYMAIAVFLQKLFTLVIAFYPIQMSLKLHAPSKKLLGLPAGKPSTAKYWALRFQLKLSQYLEQFHTFNLYTLNYGKFGRIRYSSGKLVFFYCKVLISAYLVKLVTK